MIQDELERKIEGMDKRKLLFLLGEHLSGKTNTVIKYLKSKFDEDYKDHYIDVGLYIQKVIQKEYISKYEIYPDEFIDDSKDIFKQLIEEKLIECSNNLYVLDHLEFLLSENITEWISMLDRLVTKKFTVIVVVPNEFKNILPIRAYDYLEVV